MLSDDTFASSSPCGQTILPRHKILMLNSDTNQTFRLLTSKMFLLNITFLEFNLGVSEPECWAEHIIIKNEDRILRDPSIQVF